MGERSGETSENPGGGGEGKGEGDVEGACEYEAFARSILKEPENREKILIVLEFFLNKSRQKAEKILQNLVGQNPGESFEARAVITLYSMVHGAKYSEFMSDLLHTSRVLMRLGINAAAASMILVGLQVFGASDLNPLERKYVDDFLRQLQKDHDTGISKGFRTVIDAYCNNTLKPDIQLYWHMRLKWLEKLRGKPLPREIWIAGRALLIASCVTAGVLAALKNIPMPSVTTSTREKAREQAFEGDQFVEEPKKISEENQPVVKVQARKQLPEPAEMTERIPLARKICSQIGNRRNLPTRRGLPDEGGLPVERRTKIFNIGERQVRVICGVEEGLPFLDLAERIPPYGTVPEKVTVCHDSGLDDTADNCGATTGSDQPPIHMAGPPRLEFNAWLQGALQDVADKMEK